MSFQKLGIGTRNPNKTLDVSGSVHISETVDISDNVTVDGDLTVGSISASSYTSQGMVRAQTFSIGSQGVISATRQITATDVEVKNSTTGDSNVIIWGDTGNVDMSGGTLTVDTINEQTTNNGVVIESVTLNNGAISASSYTSAGTVNAQTFSIASQGVISATRQITATDVEVKSSGGDSNVLIWGETGNIETEGTLTVDTINEKTTNNGVVIESVTLNNGSIDAPSDIRVNDITIGKGSGNFAENTAVGYEALKSNTTGVDNTATGYNALTSSTTGNRNTANGYEALKVSTGYWNTAVGYGALSTLLGGGSNVGVGHKAGLNAVNSVKNVFVGMNTGFNNIDATYQESTAIGFKSQITASNQIMLGRNTETVVIPGDLNVNGNAFGITKTMVDLGNVDNTSDDDKPVSTAQEAALDLKANIESPAFTGTPSAPTATSGTNNTQLATTAFVQTRIGEIIDSSPAALDTLNELAAALGDDANFSTTITTLIGDVSTNLQTNTSNIATNTSNIATNTTDIATNATDIATNATDIATNATDIATNATDIASNATSIATNKSYTDVSLNLKSNLASPTFTGTPSAPTATSGTNNTQLATTAFVQTRIGEIIDSSPAALDTLNELAAALGDDANFSTTITTLIADISTNLGTNTTNIASNKSYTDASLNLKANLISPTFTGVPTAPTATSGTNTTQLATTEYVTDAVSSVGVDLTQDISVNSLTIGRGSGDILTNTAVGYEALKSNTSGFYNTAFGYQALYLNKTGLINTAIGYKALYSNISNNNVAIGQQALANNDGVNSYKNTAIGHYALANGNTRSTVAVGFNAGYNNTTGIQNTFLGSDTDISPTNATWTNSTAIGYNAKITASNQIMLGTSTETVEIPGDCVMNGAVDISGSVSITGELSVTNQNNTTIINTTINDYTLIITEDISLNGNFNASGDALFGGTVQLTSSGDSILKITGDNTNSDESKHPYLIFQQDGNFNEAGIFLGSGGTSNHLTISASTNGGGNILFKTDTTSGQNDDISNLEGAPTRMTITNSGDFGIGTTSPSAKLEVNGNAFASGFYSTSDYRIKNDIVPINDTSYNIDNIRPVFYNNTKSERPEFGVIAHEVQELFPFLVSGEKDGEQNQTVNYTGFMGLIISEVQGLKKQDQLNKEKIIKLQNQLDNVMTILNNNNLS